VTSPIQFFLQEIKVKSNVVRNKNGSLRYAKYIGCYGLKAWGIGHHLIGYTREMPNKGRDRAIGVQQCMERIDHGLAIVAKHSNFGDPGRAFDSSGRFNVDNTVHALKLRQRAEIFLNKMPARST
jgi:hypothetical protein